MAQALVNGNMDDLTCGPFPSDFIWVFLKIKQKRGKPQVHVSTYQGSILVPAF